MSGAGSTPGIFGALNGLQSKDSLTQLGIVVGLLRNGDALVKQFSTDGTGFLSTDATKLLEQFGAVLGIANVGNLEHMLNKGQEGAANDDKYCRTA